jgi:putative aldouronate transport system substrate-binding protein
MSSSSYGSKTTNMDVATVDKAINALVNEKYNLNVTQEYIDDYAATIQRRLSAKENIDIYWANGGSTTNALVNSNAMYDISAKLKEHKVYETMPEIVWNAIAYGKGEIYHVPTYKESAAGSDFMIAKRHAEALKWELPTKATFEEITPFVKELYEAKLVEWAYVPSFTQASSYAREHGLQEEIAQINEYLAVEFKGDATKVVLAPETKAYKDMADLMASWVKEGYVSQDVVLADTQVKFSKDTVLANQAGFGYYPTVPNNQEQCDIAYGEPMAMVTHVSPQMSNTTPLGSAYGIASYTKDVDAALSYFDALYTDIEFADLTCYGVEGKHYNRNDKNEVEKIKDSGYNNGAWSCVNVMCVSLTVGEAADKAEKYKAYNEAASLSPIAGFHFDTAALAAETQALNAVVTKYDKTLLYGITTSEITLENYIKDLKGAGVEKVLEECQKQYTEWYNANKK